MADDDNHPADEHIAALKKAIGYMSAIKNISPGYEEQKQANQAQSISDAVPRGLPGIRKK